MKKSSAILIAAATLVGYTACQTFKNQNTTSRISASYEEEAKPLTADELAQWEHRSIGTEVYPLVWLRAINSANFTDSNKKLTLPLWSSPADMEKRLGLKKSNYRKVMVSGREREYVMPYAGMTVLWTNQKPENKDAFLDEEEIVKNIGQMKSIKLAGANCALCHQAEISAGNSSVVIRGAPSQVDIRGYYKDVIMSTLAIFFKTDLMESFLDRVKQQNRSLNFDSKAEAERLYKTFQQEIGKATLNEGLGLDKVPGLKTASYWWTVISVKPPGPLSSLSDNTQFRKIKEPIKNAYLRLARLTHGLNESDDLGELEDIATWFGRAAVGDRKDLVETPFMFGRSDAFGTLGNTLARGEDTVNLNGSVAFPWIWGTKYMAMKHYNANMNSTVNRNVGATLALGATYNPEKQRTAINLHSLKMMEEWSYRLGVPRWEKTFSQQQGLTEFQIREDLALQGKPIYEKQCASCHETNTFVGPQKNLRNYQTPNLHVIGTDPYAAINIITAVRDPKTKKHLGGFSELASKVTAKAEEIYYKQNEISTWDAEDLSDRKLRGKDIMRDTYLGFNQADEAGLDYGNVLAGSGYKARHLSGVWATGPFLHNDSVPTLIELLSQDSKRPKAFIIKGRATFDPQRVGIKTQRYSACPKTENLFEKCLDTKLQGNSNSGHNYGVNLTDKEKYALIEYLKILPPEPEYQ